MGNINSKVGSYTKVIENMGLNMDMGSWFSSPMNTIWVIL